MHEQEEERGTGWFGPDRVPDHALTLFFLLLFLIGGADAESDHCFVGVLP